MKACFRNISDRVSESVTYKVFPINKNIFINFERVSNTVVLNINLK